ncbi:hypothetical protein [Natronococcus sp.]|uniref:hypothetical protein n=1 Tax=Natronococcus sp. TaxID=35747 RepID=UPI0025F38303|nr:hypothetical protein [Natronococcus sp.]
MAERVEPHPVVDRLVCPNCPADYPTPFSRRHISCRRCGTEFLAPDEARNEDSGPESQFEDDAGTGLETDRRADDGDGERTGRYLQLIRTSAPAIAFGFNGVALGFWIAGVASFEVAVMSVLLVTNGVVFRDRL